MTRSHSWLWRSWRTWLITILLSILFLLCLSTMNCFEISTVSIIIFAPLMLHLLLYLFFFPRQVLSSGATIYHLLYRSSNVESHRWYNFILYVVCVYTHHYFSLVSYLRLLWILLFTQNSSCICLEHIDPVLNTKNDSCCWNKTFDRNIGS